MKQSSIEWLVDQLPLIQQEGLRDIIQQAKLMHKQEIVNAFNSGDFIHHYQINLDKDGHEYYNETYGGNK